MKLSLILLYALFVYAVTSSFTSGSEIHGTAFTYADQGLESSKTTSIAENPTRHIIRFANEEARRRYIERLQGRAHVELIDSVFIGAVVTHSDTEKCLEEEQHIQQLNQVAIQRNLMRKRLQQIGLENGIETEHTSEEEELGEDMEGIMSFERDGYVSIAKTEKQTNAPWHLDRISRKSLPLKGEYEYSEDGIKKETNVYIVDTGIYKDHKEFGNRVRAAYSASKSLKAGEDCHGHGTHVAGLVGGKVSGVFKKAILHDVRVMDCMGSSLNSDLVKALDWISKNAQKPAVINLSLGGEPSTMIDKAVAELWKKGLFVVMAAGNEGVDACRRSPARISEGVTVGASNKKDKRAPFSNYGDCVNVYSPGEDIESAGHLGKDKFHVMSGTSMAAPIVAGIAAVLYAKESNLSVDKLKEKLLHLSNKDVSESIKPLVFLPATKGTSRKSSHSEEYLTLIARINDLPAIVQPTESITLDGTPSLAIYSNDDGNENNDESSNISNDDNENSDDHENADDHENTDDDENTNDNEDLTYAWSCEELNGHSGVENRCAELRCNEKTCQVSKDLLNKMKGGDYRVTLVVGKGNKRAQASRLLKVGTAM